MNRFVTQRAASASAPHCFRLDARSQKRQLTLFALCLSLLCTVAPATADFGPTTLTKSDPFRLVVDPTGKMQEIAVRGTNFENQNHGDNYQYMHWQVRRSDGSWQRGNATPDLKTTAGPGMFSIS